MGVGKTTIGKVLAESLGLEFVDSDREIERVTGADIPWIFDVEGEEGFRARESKMIEQLNLPHQYCPREQAAARYWRRRTDSG